MCCSFDEILPRLLHCFGFRGPDNASLSWQKPESDGGKAISHYQLEVRENKMTEFVKGKVFTIAEVRENKEGQILAKVGPSPQLLILMLPHHLHRPFTQ